MAFNVSSSFSIFSFSLPVLKQRIPHVHVSYHPAIQVLALSFPSFFRLTSSALRSLSVIGELVRYTVLYDFDRTEESSTSVVYRLWVLLELSTTLACLPAYRTPRNSVSDFIATRKPSPSGLKWQTRRDVMAIVNLRYFISIAGWLPKEIRRVSKTRSKHYRMHCVKILWRIATWLFPFTDGGTSEGRSLNILWKFLWVSFSRLDLHSPGTWLYAIVLSFPYMENKHPVTSTKSLGHTTQTI